MATCPCDHIPHPPVPAIPAGLDRLPRQIATFGVFRRALLGAIGTYPALDAWRAREGDDFGVMILEWWAYVLDVLAFYSGEIAGESYLRTAQREESIRRLVAMIGYTPKPPLAASATLALFAAPGQPVVVPPRTAFRSDAFGDEAPQVFETDAETVIDASLNEWTVAPIRPPSFGTGPLLLATDRAGLREGQLALLTWDGAAHAARATTVETVTLLDGVDYVRVTLDPPPAIPSAQAVAGIRPFVVPLRAAMNLFAGGAAVSQGAASVTLVLDALYPQIGVGGRVVLENGETGALHPAMVSATDLSDQSLGDAAAGTAPFTRVTLAGAGPAWIGTAPTGALTLHFGPVPAGRVVKPGKTEITLADLQGGADLTAPVAPFHHPTAGLVMLRDALEAGAALAADVTAAGTDGAATLIPLAGAEPFAAPLRTPVTAHGNLVTVSRGETVEETLGRGDATLSFQRFVLAKAPLTYLSAPGTPTGRSSTLEIRIDGVRWSEVASLFTAGPDDRVYTVRRTVDGETEVTFGGQGNGQKLPTGSTVTARYRYGAGAASPPAGGLRQLMRPVTGLRRAVNPLAAFGGDDGDAPDAIRTAAPDSALSLGRAVSLVDFEAIARGYRGILNAAALMAWDEREQRAAVTVWFIPPHEAEAGQLRGDLEAHLRTISAPGTPIAVAVAAAVPVALAFDISGAPDRDAAAVAAAATAALADPEDGLFAKRRVPIGAPVFRADILAALRAVDGVAEVRGLSADGAPAPFVLTTGEGEYLSATVVATG